MKCMLRTTINLVHYLPNKCCLSGRGGPRPTDVSKECIFDRCEQLPPSLDWETFKCRQNQIFDITFPPNAHSCVFSTPPPNTLLTFPPSAAKTKLRRNYKSYENHHERK